MTDSEDSASETHELIQHRSLQVLMPHLRENLRKALEQLRSGCDTFRWTAAEIYAGDVFGRVSELDNSLMALSMSSKFVNELVDRTAPDLNIYRYHYENFVLRLIGIDDRAHRLAGSACALSKEKFEGLGGNRFVRRHVEANFTEVVAPLQAVAAAVANYREPRNELIHNSAFSSRELGLLVGVRALGMDEGGVALNDLTREYLVERRREIDFVIANLRIALMSLLNALTPLFEIAASND